jgi:hypothetical protein
MRAREGLRAHSHSTKPEIARGASEQYEYSICNGNGQHTKAFCLASLAIKHQTRTHDRSDGAERLYKASNMSTQFEEQGKGIVDVPLLASLL